MYSDEEHRRFDRFLIVIVAAACTVIFGAAIVSGYYFSQWRLHGTIERGDSICFNVDKKEKCFVFLEAPLEK